mgnify:CR=1 FL=1
MNWGQTDKAITFANEVLKRARQSGNASQRLTGGVACLKNKCVRKFILNVFLKVPVNRKCIRKCVYAAQSF